jgi:N-acetylmuramoyl-L-alanine amidase
MPNLLRTRNRVVPLAVVLALGAMLAWRPSPPAPVVCIDPGHPSEVSAGDEVINGIAEAHANWIVAQKLREELAQMGYVVCMTKQREDTLVRNRDRAEIANRANAALLIRLHCDVGRDSGYAVYYPDRAGTAEGHRGPSDSVMEMSHRAALKIHAAMADRLARYLHDGGVLGDSKTFVGSKQGALTGSVFSQVPVVTVEMVVLSHKADAQFIASEAGSSQIAEAIAAGIRNVVGASR